MHVIKVCYDQCRKKHILCKKSLHLKNESMFIQTLYPTFIYFIMCLLFIFKGDILNSMIVSILLTRLLMNSLIMYDTFLADLM